MALGHISVSLRGCWVLSSTHLTNPQVGKAYNGVLAAHSSPIQPHRAAGCCTSSAAASGRRDAGLQQLLNATCTDLQVTKLATPLAQSGCGVKMVPPAQTSAGFLAAAAQTQKVLAGASAASQPFGGKEVPRGMRRSTPHGRWWQQTCSRRRCV